jgi:hypothetical protein
MATTTNEDANAERQIRKLGAQFREHRQYPCLLFVSRSIQGSDVLAVRTAVGRGHSWSAGGLEMAQERWDVSGGVRDREDLQRFMVSVINDEVSADWPEQHWT